jgi:hypothetical protein
MKERISINNYFDIFKGKPAELSKIPKVVKPAVDILIADGKFVSQLHAFDKDETIFLAARDVESPDVGLGDSDYQ